MKYKCVAIDGPAGSGKSTIARKIADLLDWKYIDTGAMYRAITLKIIAEGVALDHINAIEFLLDKTSIDFKRDGLLLDGEDVTVQIRSEAVEERVSAVSAIKEIRIKMVDLQREYAKAHNVVMDGRDIGTVVFPNAEYKFFLTASAEERARRRHIQLLEKGIVSPFEKILKDIVRRDYLDSTRDISPLKKAVDAILIDTDKLGIEEVIEVLMSQIKKTYASY